MCESDNIKKLNRIVLFSGALSTETDFYETADEQIDSYIKSVNQAWDSAVFSNRSDESLRRYFYYIQAELTQGIAEPFEADTLSTLLDLMATLVERHTRYIDTLAAMPMQFVNYFLQAFRIEADLLLKTISESAIDDYLKNCLLPLFHVIMNANETSKISLGTLHFFKSLCKAFNALNWQAKGNIDNEVTTTLETLNFNHLGFLAWKQQNLSSALPDDASARLHTLRQMTIRYQCKPQNPPYDPSWPDLPAMLSGWLTEEFRFTEKLMLNQNTNPVPVQKLSLNVSVAHLALIIRMFVDEKLIAQENLSMIFNFISRHFRTKRQDCISPGSFSKEYYSAGQVTAAVVRDYFLRMARRIDHQFFPVWVVISAAGLAALNIG